ncbi:MAG: hypothetical protein Q8R55_03855 [Candidatus Taylorbacteria bacterium]|nr:hypothetical protein [Candidatus Taylorbacteria bacterium]
MNNEQQQVRKPFYKTNWFFATFLILFALTLIIAIFDSSSKIIAPPPQPPLPWPLPLSTPPTPLTPTPPISTWGEISKTDQARMREIFTGVMQNTIPVTPDIKNELRNIFTKYNTTDAEINDFATYGPAFVTNYQKLFFTDALRAVTSGVPVKSQERLSLEKEALSRGLMTHERIATNDKTMNLIANNQPVIGSDGKQASFTVYSIYNTLNNISSITVRLKSLLK